VDVLSVVLASPAEDWHTHTQPIITRKYLREQRGQSGRLILVAEDEPVIVEWQIPAQADGPPGQYG